LMNKTTKTQTHWTLSKIQWPDNRSSS
jgi:hypothetical protein